MRYAYCYTEFLFQSLLQEKINQLEESIKSQQKDNSERVESLHRQHQEVKGQLQTAHDKIERLEATLTEKQERIESLVQKQQQLEGELKAKVCVCILPNFGPCLYMYIA